MTTLVPSFLNGSSFLEVTSIIIKAWTSLNFSKIPPPTTCTELAALKRLKNK